MPSIAVITYILYILISVALTIWVARTLSNAGQIFLLDVFGGREKLAEAINHLLVVGFYLINMGYVTLALESGVRATTTEEAIEILSWKLGMVLLVLGFMHFFNMYVFSRIHTRAKLNAAPPPVAPDGSVATGGAA